MTLPPYRLNAPRSDYAVRSRYSFRSAASKNGTMELVCIFSWKLYTENSVCVIILVVCMQSQN